LKDKNKKSCMFALTANTSADIQHTFTITHMFELSELKAKKLAELQEIAKELGIKKITALKKIELTYRIIDHQSTLPEEGEQEEAQQAAAKPEAAESKKPVRERERAIKRTIKTTKATKATERLRTKNQIIETIKNRISQDKNNSTIRATAITITKEIATITETMLLKKGIITKITATAIASLIMSLRAL
jgi:hypothetical protein